MSLLVCLWEMTIPSTIHYSVKLPPSGEPLFIGNCDCICWLLIQSYLWIRWGPQRCHMSSHIHVISLQSKLMSEGLNKMNGLKGCCVLFVAYLLPDIAALVLCCFVVSLNTVIASLLNCLTLFSLFVWCFRSISLANQNEHYWRPRHCLWHESLSLSGGKQEWHRSFLCLGPERGTCYISTLYTFSYLF